MPRRPPATRRSNPPSSEPRSPSDPVDWMDERIEPAQNIDPMQSPLPERRHGPKAEAVGQAVESRRGSHK